MEYFGICPASCGELIQGKNEDGEFLASYCIPLYAKAVILCEGKKENSRLYAKANEALKQVFQYYGEEKFINKVSLKLSGNIPRGKGMSSSSADIGAVIGACASFLNIEISPSLATKLAADIEPTDSIFYEDITLIDPVQGKYIKSLGKLQNMKALILEPHNIVKTESMRKNPDYGQYKTHRMSLYKELLIDLEQAISKGDNCFIGKTSAKSALLNQQLLFKPHIDRLLEIAADLSAFGINAAHSGSTVAILMDKEEDLRIYKERLIKEKISETYGRMYCLPIIGGGIKNWREKDGICEKSSKN